MVNITVVEFNTS